jgi:predicted fused transcriptional regulator/phosphomethylpyrimidine kinase
MLDGEPLTVRLPSGGAREAVLADLAQARKRLSQLLARLSPEVRCNLAFALPDAKAVDAIAAFPGRLTPVSGEARPLAPPEFGASHHLAKLLLQLRQRMPARRAIVNLRWDAVVADALPRAGIRLAKLVRKGDRLELPGGGLAPALVDEGSVGWEPALYLHGDSLEEVATQVEALAVAAELTA